ncbi:MAG TPA: hypothetical protein VGQ71_01635 [Terriglobales bacterium]|jgi:hypothetical protein|nr:hypothetical protein [Terriglobales bacterium]
MPLLVMVLASLLMFLLISVVLAVANAKERRERRRVPGRLLSPPRPYRVLPLTLAFDPERAMIWETQVPALELICRSGSKGLALERLHGCYLVAARRSPELFEGCKFEQWLAFLEQERLIVSDGERATITPEGYQFVKYRVSREAGIPA